MLEVMAVEQPSHLIKIPVFGSPPERMTTVTMQLPYFFPASMPLWPIPIVALLSGTTRTGTEIETVQQSQPAITAPKLLLHCSAASISEKCHFKSHIAVNHPSITVQSPNYPCHL